MKLIVVILLLITNYAYSQQKELLEKAYRHNSRVLLDEFFFNWQSEIKTITNDEFEHQNDIIKAVYNIYDIVLRSLLNTSSNIKMKHMVFPDRIEYRFVDFFYDYFWKVDTSAYSFLLNVDTSALANLDTLSELWVQAFREKSLYTDSIINFRPFITQKGSILYANEKYQNILYDYMFGVDQMESTSRVMEITRFPFEAISKKIAFLEDQIPVPMVKYSEGNVVYSSGTSIMTEPELYLVSFGNKFNTAQVDYYMNCNVCRAYLIKVNNKWKLLKTKEKMCVCG